MQRLNELRSDRTTAPDSPHIPAPYSPDLEALRIQVGIGEPVDFGDCPPLPDGEHWKVPPHTRG